MKIVFWNVRGVNNLCKHRRVGEVLAYVNPDWVGLQETKLSSVFDRLISYLVCFQDMGFVFSPSTESAGGILYVWNCARFSVVSSVF